MNLLYAFGSALKFETEDSTQDVSLFKEIYKLDSDAWLVDRTKTVSFPFGETLYKPYALPNNLNTDISFDDACMRRAQELYAENKPLYIMWSGGIDSTSIITAFLKLGKPTDCITIVLNQDSIREYQIFYRTHIRGRFKIMVTEEFMINISSSVPVDGIIVSGEHADQLVGAMTVNSIMRALGPEFMQAKFTADSFRKLFSAKQFSPQAIECWYNVYSESFTGSPRPIETIYDFAWWHNFNFRWQGIGLKLYTRINKSADFRTFYSGSDFQRWSSNHQPNLNDLDTLKQEPKQFILDYTKDQLYFDTKIKHPSTTLYYSRVSAAAIDTDLNKVPYDKFNLPNYVRMDNSIAKWITK